MKWVAVVDHDKVNEEEAQLFEQQENLNPNRFTRFLALDKALPQRDFLQLVDIPTKSHAPYEFKYDAEWLAVLRNTNDLMSLTSSHIRLPIKGIDKVRSENLHFDFWNQAKIIWKKRPTNHPC